MQRSFLLPYRFKPFGAVMMLAGLVIWIWGQLKLSQDSMAKYLIGIEAENAHLLKVTILVISFFSCLIGMFFLVFSKEKEEDEYVADLRLKSFQLAAFVQMTFFLIAFLYMFLFKKEPSGDAGLELFLIASIFLFWFSYISCFQFALIKNKLQANEE
jgi:hypothetical membrane protein